MLGLYPLVIYQRGSLKLRSLKTTKLIKFENFNSYNFFLRAVYCMTVVKHPKHYTTVSCKQNIINKFGLLCHNLLSCIPKYHVNFKI